MSDDLSLNDGPTIEVLDVVYEVEDLEQIISNPKEMPIGRRKLQTAVDAAEKQYG